MALVLDAGALIAIDRRDRRVGAILRVAQEQAIAVRTSAAVVAQVWRGGHRQANLGRILAGVDTVALDGSAGKQIGGLLARSRGADIVDGHVGLLVQQGDTVLTSDPGDIRTLLRARAVTAAIRKV